MSQLFVTKLAKIYINSGRLSHCSLLLSRRGAANNQNLQEFTLFNNDS